MSSLPLPEITAGGVGVSAWYAWQFNAAGLSVSGALAAGAVSGLIVTAASVVAVRGAMRTWQLLRGEKVAPPVLAYDLPDWPESPGISLVLGEDHGSLDGSFCTNPSWYVIPAKGLYTGIAIIGATGGSKTAGLIRPALSQLLAYGAGTLDKAPAALIQDFKASLVPVAVEVAAECGRSNDLILIGPAQPYRWNPIHDPYSEPRVLAGRLMSALENLSGGAVDAGSAWIADGASRCAESAIGMLRAANGYVTLKDVHELVASIVRACAEDDKAEGDAGALEAVLIALDGEFFGKQPAPADMAQYTYYRAFWTTEFKPQADKFRAIYASELGRLTQYFADPRYAHLYSPEKNDIDLPSWDDAIDRGLIVVLDATTSLYGPLGIALGVFLKLAMQRAALSRPARCRDNPTLNNTRAIIYCVDEFQEFVSSGTTGGDDQFFALARESKVISIVATQSRSSLTPKLQEDRTRRLLASLRTKIFLALADDKDYEYAANLISKRYQAIESASVQEHVTEAEQAAGQFVGAETSVSESRSIKDELRHDVEPATFRDLPAFTAIVSGFDGNAAMQPALVRLKAYWRPKGETYAEFLPIFLEESRV